MADHDHVVPLVAGDDVEAVTVDEEEIAKNWRSEPDEGRHPDQRSRKAAEELTDVLLRRRRGLSRFVRQEVLWRGSHAESRTRPDHGCSHRPTRSDEPDHATSPEVIEWATGATCARRPAWIGWYQAPE